MATQFSLKETLRDYLHGQSDEEVVLTRLNASLKKTGGEFTHEEVQWLRAHFDKIPTILRSKVACAVYLAVDRAKGAYLRQLCRKLGKGRPLNPTAVNYWLRKFFTVELLQKNRAARGWGTEIYYYTPKLRMPNLVAFLKESMAERIVEGQDLARGSKK